MKIIGMMTGTSLDAVDICLCEFNNYMNKHKMDIITFNEYEIPKVIKKNITNVISENVHIAEISKLNFNLADLYADVYFNFVKENNIDIKEIEAVGIHGQTVWHEPISKYNNYGNTLQLGNGSVIANKIKKKVVWDFRTADIALGGQGAPLVPIFDKEYLSEEDHNIGALNIGGIANITYLPKNNLDNVIAFDTGPGNMLIDQVCNLAYGKKYDENGDIAKSGNLMINVFEQLKKDKYNSQNPPKSTGKEKYNPMFINKYFPVIDNAIDIIRTLTEYTAWSIHHNIERYLPKMDKIYVSGGGLKNTFLIDKLKELFYETEILSINKKGIDSNAKEAAAFAYLAFRTLNGLSSNIPNVTGASRKAVLGSVALI